MIQISTPLSPAPASLQDKFEGGGIPETWADQARLSIRAARWLKKAQFATYFLFGVALGVGGHWLPVWYSYALLATAICVALILRIRTRLISDQADRLRKRVLSSSTIVEKEVIDGKAA